MKVYQVTMSYFDGDRDHGEWRSPLFTRREDADAFLAALRALPRVDRCRWWTDYWDGEDSMQSARVAELKIVEQWDGSLPPCEKCLFITYT